MRWLALALVVWAGCGAGLKTRRPLKKETSDSFLRAVAQRDPIAIADHFATTLSYGGMYFTDPACMQKFPTPMKIDEDKVSAFAECVAKLDLRDANRVDAMYGVSVYEYSPGIEVEAKFEDIGEGAQLVWIGYSGRRGLFDALPTVTPAAIERSRIAGTPKPRLSPEDAAKLEAESKQLTTTIAWAWMKLCLDADGNITGLHVREASSPLAEQVLTAATQEWKFGPVLLDGRRGTPVCSLFRFTHPETTDREVIPLAFAIPAGAVRIPNVHARRISGEILVAPDDRGKSGIMRSGVETLVGAFAYCFDETGRVNDVAVLEPTGLKSYDALIMKHMREWEFQPYVIDGKPVKACSAATFIYTQRYRR